MRVWDNDTWQWWLQYGFDGIAGGIIGAAVTGGAVVWTVRHERILRERADRKAALDDVRKAILELHGKMADLRWMQFGEIVDLRNGVLRMRAELLLTETAVRGTNPETADRVSAIRSDLDALPRNHGKMFSRSDVHDFRERSEAVLLEVLETLAD